MSTSEGVIECLSSKSNEFASYSPDDMLKLCHELQNNFRDRANEWLEVGDWRVKEMAVMKYYEKGAETSDAIPVLMSSTSQLISALLSSFISSCVRNYEYEAGKSKGKEEILKKRTVKMGDGNGRSYSIYGPAPTGIPSHNFELYTLPVIGEHVASPTVSKNGSVAVILGAGNQPFLTLFDILHHTLLNRRVSLVKHHPMRPHLIDPYAIILEPLIKRGFLRQILDLGIPETTKILSHPSIGHVHITGSLATDRAVRTTLSKSKANLSEAEVDAMVSSELGASTPFIIANGSYTDKEIRSAAKLIVFGKKMNGGCNCLCAQAVVVPKDWEQKSQFRKVLNDELKLQPNQPVYYPGSIERAEEIVKVYASHGDARVNVLKSSKTVGAVNRLSDNITVVECGTPGDTAYDNSVLLKEVFGPVLAIVELASDAGDTNDYLNSAAVPFVNNKENIYGSLSCTVIAPSSLESKELSRALETLEYGSICVNTLSVVGWLSACHGGIWGAHPAAPGRESGAGYCGNQFKVALPAKTVVHGPNLAQDPMFDGSKPTPKLILDALVIMDCSHSTFSGIMKILRLLLITSVNMLFSRFSRLAPKTKPY
mmetsp:Transcript_25504/g.58837  ORF Transcript_25504/g.58837 Transcript_25504/m.58837 type:complete len:598 (-) Transcript_25504:228-2021(-)